MKLRQFLITNYRSIVESGIVDVEEGVTVLIGKNEQGKTNVLRALLSFNLEKTFLPSDLPNHLRPSLEEKNPKEIPVVTLWLTLDSEDRTKLNGIIENVDSIAQLKCIRYYGNNYAYWAVLNDGTEQGLKITQPDISAEKAKIKEAADGLKNKLEVHGVRLPPFAVNKDQIAQIIDALVNADYSNVTQLGDVVKTFSTALKGLPAQDPPIQEDISATSKLVEGYYSNINSIFSQTDYMSRIRQSLPTFVYHSTKTDQIPNEVNITQFVADPESSRGMLNLCRAAGLSIQKIKQLASTVDTSQREAYEDHYKSHISGGLNEFWTQEKYLVHFRIEKEKLYVSVSDDTYSPRIAPSDRSEGFQWYLSFYSSLLNEVGDINRVVLLLDNPALELHVDGQRDIKRFLEEKMTFNSQIIYVTHSPAMIDPFNLVQLRKVVLHGDNKGTKVLASIFREGDDFDLLEPVRSAIGMSLIASLIVNDFNVLVEGAADKPILEGAFEVSKYQDQHKILVNGSLAESKEGFLARFYARTKLPFVVLLDADSRGRELKEELKKWSIPERLIIELNEIFEDKKDDFAIEDILSEDFYHKAYHDAYPKHDLDRPDSTGKKRAIVYEDAFKKQFGIGLSKRRVAEASKKLLMKAEADSTTRENLKYIQH
jgi:predicted ATP-dependent endonuclease of OLD family